MKSSIIPPNVPYGKSYSFLSQVATVPNQTAGSSDLAGNVYVRGVRPRAPRPRWL